MNIIEQQVAKLLQLFGICARLASTFDKKEPSEDAKRVLGEIRITIEAIWSSLAAIAAARFKGTRLDDAQPGYVIRDEVLVPFYLLEDLPETDQLVEIATLGLSLRVTKQGVICLSGSTALLGSLKFVGDIDYCEYALPGN